MRNVFNYIEKRTVELESNPFIQWLADTSVPPRERLSTWLPCAAFFVFGFKDLNGEALSYPEEEALLDPLKMAINHHAAEDSKHWPWYLSDMRTLGLDPPARLSDTLKFLWSDQNAAQRRGVYRLYSTAARFPEPILRYAMIAALESYAHLLFGTVTRVSQEFEEQAGIRLKYLGPVHFDREPGHLANQEDDTELLLSQRVLDDRAREQAIEIAGIVCDVIDQRWREFYIFACNSQRCEPAAELAAAVHPTAKSGNR
jgi:hypothetical protein